MDSSDSVTEISDDVSTCLWWSGLDFVDLSISHSHNSVSKGFETDIVSNHNHSNLFFHVQVDKNFHDDVSAARIEISGRLIEKQNLGLVGNGASNRNTLLLTTRQLVGEVVHSLLKADILQKLAGSLADLLTAEFTLELHWQLYILEGSERAYQIECLEHEA